MGKQELWKQIPTGGYSEQPGSTSLVRTGDWRSEVPVLEIERCTHCMICWIDCPDASFQVAESKLVGIDLDHCKGCGICVEVCPTKCIEMVPDTPGAGGVK